MSRPYLSRVGHLSRAPTPASPDVHTAASDTIAGGGRNFLQSLPPSSYLCMIPKSEIVSVANLIVTVKIAPKVVEAAS